MKKPRKDGGDDPGLFGAPPAVPPVVVTRSPPCEPKAEAPRADRKPAEKTAADYVAETRAMIDAVLTTVDVVRAKARWDAETPTRIKVGLELRDERMLKAALDGRCNRVRDGLAPTGKN
jgi:hypothetical protein